MTIIATVLDTQDCPVSEDFIVENDDFSEAEEAAEATAEAGTKCCIRWSRSSDGQVAYWGPSGAAFKPHWYAKPGRPSEMSGGKAVKVYLDAESIAIATRLGNGNVSEGIRKALKQAGEINARSSVRQPAFCGFF
jgi:hypothetical protein